MYRLCSYLFIAAFALCIPTACTHIPQYAISQPDLTINLRWNKAYVSESGNDIDKGLKWAFSFLGASMQDSSYNKAVIWEGNIVHVNFKSLGFSYDAQTALSKLISLLKNSGEYFTNNSIDIGRFIMLTLNTSSHYYAITGANPAISTLRDKYSFDHTQAAVIESAVSKQQRAIEISDNTGKHIAFIASEGHGSLLDHTFSIEEYEVLDVMDNGQLRFAVYNLNGTLMQASNPDLSSAGKPAKCLWCHEINIQPPFKALTAAAGYYSPAVFKSIVQNKQHTLDSLRSAIKSDIDFTQTTEHTYAELLYISFMEPSAFRLAAEWNISIDSVQHKLAGLNTHTNAEFPFLGNLYDRKDIDTKAPYVSIPVPWSAREISGYEPSMLQ